MADIVDQLDNLPEDETARVDVLRLVTNSIRDIWDSNSDDPSLIGIAQKIGNAARIESNRAPIGVSGLLDLVCSLLPDAGVRIDLIVQFLRIIGNASADQDENREKVVDSGCLPSIVSLLRIDSILAFAITVLHNLTVDYEPAQKAVYQAGINPELIKLMTSPRSEEVDAVMSHIIRLLEVVATQEHDSALIHPDTPLILLGMADSQSLPSDTSEFLSLSSLALSYLAQESLQTNLLKSPGSVTLILQAFFKACTSCDIPESSTDDQAQLKQVQTAFASVLADLSAHPLFASSCPLDGEEVRMVQAWFSASNSTLKSGACLMLGNLARSDENCTHLVQKLAIHTQLIAILSNTELVDAGALHSALSFLKNLAILAENRPILGSAGAFDMNVLPRFWELTTQTQVQFDAISLTRLLLLACPENASLICAPIVEDQESPENTKSRLHILISVNESSDQQPTIMETARAISLVCSAVNKQSLASSQTDLSPATSDAKSANGATPLPSLEKFYATYGTITNAIFRLAQQSKYPTLRTELTLTLALMARADSGAAVIAQALHEPGKADLISEILTSTSTAPGAERQNTLVLITELLKRCPDKLPEGLKETFGELLQSGGERLLREREETEGP